MSELTLATKQSIVSMAARGRSRQNIADITGLPVAVVQQVSEQYGAPDMGRLATSADELRKQLDAQAGHPGVGHAAADSVDLLKAEAERVGATKLVKRAEHVASVVDQLRVDVKAAVAAWDAQAAVREHRKAIEDQIAALKAELEKTGEVDAKVVRAWALASKVECPTHGRIPQSVRDAYAKATR